MSTIWQFPLTDDRYQTLELTQGAQLFAAQAHNGVICLWALLDPAAAPKLFHIRIYPTGADLDDTPLRYLGTVQLDNGTLGGHVFVVEGQ